MHLNALLRPGKKDERSNLRRGSLWHLNAVLHRRKKRNLSDLLRNRSRKDLSGKQIMLKGMSDTDKHYLGFPLRLSANCISWSALKLERNVPTPVYTKSNVKEEHMKKSKGFSVVICISFVAMLFLPGFVKNALGQGEEEKTKVEEQSGEAATTKEKFHEEREEFERTTKEKIDKLDKKMDELEAKVKEAGSNVKAESKEQLQELKEKRAALKEDMEKLESSSEKTWETVKRKVEHAMDELEEAYNKVRDKF